MDINIDSNKIPLPSGSYSCNIDDEKLKKYSLKDLMWAFKTLYKFKEAKDSLVEVMKMLAEAGIDTSKINWNDPFSIMNAFLTVKGMNVDIDIDEIVEKLDKISDVKFEDIDKALDIIDTFIRLSSKAEKIAKIVSKRGYTAKEFDMLMSLLGIGNVGISKHISSEYEEYDESNDENDRVTNEELEKIKEIVNRYKSKNR